ncbi:hypothetical protein L227DRAFT_153090 [Lentinus tigrinus ALCF2SS1-6]|uniref:F-box domain-containing protein n=1 Tax=Lentinus tigrinus ALCF2SS1-6 TaxID=1328759 RepID=A0A5C2S8N7_9APHY|nr:hypothetical protein L227DRAFT_153090 [Lentinus tigrinus ALCF2SS1-6]
MLKLILTKLKPRILRKQPTRAALSGRARTLSLCSLPSEVLVHIICLCNIAEIFSCSLVCRSFEYLVRTDIYIRYKILLDINGMVDGPPSSTPVSERLRLLKSYTFQLRNGTDAAARSSALPHWCVTPENEDWAPSLSFASFTSYIIRKPRLNLVEVFCPAIDFLDTPHHWVIPLARNFPGGKVLEVSVDVVQDLLLVFQEEADESSVSRHLISYVFTNIVIVSSHQTGPRPREVTPTSGQTA